MNLIKLLGDPTDFVLKILRELKDLEIHLDRNAIDHLCFKPETFEEYQDLKIKINNEGQLLSEAIINKRPISTFELHQPYIIDDYPIPLLELAAPKPLQNKKSHFEHFEVVTNDWNLRSFYQKFQGLNWDLSKIDDKVNPDITLHLKNGLVKFHPTSLKDVIEKEKAK